ncbi:hypothetical protein POJ06DRAFT_242274 [Lipomyces tetrasporus]|uniref:Uncharacterized protein n=1 Tax=Lipomyces tetrasporus TaxID=54092 RepID=A0AAD7VUW4_9ASCO|nr:uncharacterized protein POJ06DRAFT_242274 [Lipomyces tetrasporus]KAJ8103567.1 hypothetical protein POJ06DRAFT_242274 [Lipomyces tetrasporus]
MLRKFKNFAYAKCKIPREFTLLGLQPRAGMLDSSSWLDANYSSTDAELYILSFSVFCRRKGSSTDLVAGRLQRTSAREYGGRVSLIVRCHN